MDSLRDRIATIIYSHYGGVPGSSNHMLADKILSLLSSEPSGVVAVSKCPHCKSIRGPKASCGNYPPCNKGTISRELTVQELAEIPKMILRREAYTVQTHEYFAIYIKATEERLEFEK